MNWQLTPLSIALKLKELGVVQTSEFYWNEAKDGPHKEATGYGWTSKAIASAYTVAELGVMMEKHTSLIDPEVYAERVSTKLLRYLESGVMTVEVVNKRLQEIITRSDNKSVN